MSAAAAPAKAELLVGSNFPAMLDRRGTPSAVDVDPTLPMRRASDARPMANTLTLQAFKASDRRFTGAPISNWGALS